MRAFHSLTASDTLSALQSSPVGLSEAEAQSRLQRLGENALPSRKKGGPFRLFLAQFKDFMTILLLCAAALSAVVAFGAEDAGGLTDTGILLLIVLLNAVVGFIQQYRADTAVEKLDRLSVCRVKAVRGGRDLLLDSRALVPGDLIVLEEGDMIPADCRVLRAEELRCDESALTGVSSGVSLSDAPVPESAPLAERRCMLYSSSFVVRGRAAAVVVGTGKDTEIGQIAGILAQTDAAKTPLEKALSVLGRIITAFVAAVAALLFLVGIFCKGEPLLHGFLSAVAVAVAAIPEGMPAVVTVIMAMGVQKMSRERAIVRRLHAVETLGSCSCICSDKTGTLTENRMTVEEVVTDFAPFGGGEVVSAGAPSRRSPSAPSPAAAASGTRGAEGGPSSVGSANSPSSVGPVGDISRGIAVDAGGIAGVGQRESLRRLYACMLACNSVRVRGGRLSGDPTEVALVAYARGRGAALSYKRLGGIPFTSERKMMSVAAQTAEGRFLYVKGGADVILQKCSRILDGGLLTPQRETRDLLELQIPHGVRPQNASYAFTILPGATPEETANWNRTEILTNTDSCQAVRFSDGSTMTLSEGMLKKLNGRQGEMVLGIRGEDIKMDAQNMELNNANVQHAVITDTEVMGNENNLYFSFGGAQAVARVSKYEISQIGDRVSFVFMPSKMHFFDKETGVNYTEL